MRSYLEQGQAFGGVRSAATRAAGYGLAGLLALSAPMSGGRQGDRLSANVPTGLQNFPDPSPLPAGWPGPLPDLHDEHALDIWNEVFRNCRRFGIEDEALVMYNVLWEESRLKPDVVSPCGRYVGISQFLPSTFRRNVRAMRHLGLLPEGVDYSPLDPQQSISVMAWMWSQGYHRHWGPYRRVVQVMAAMQTEETIE